MPSLINTQYFWYSLAPIMAFLVTLKFVKLNRSLNYWSDRNIPGPTPIPYFGNTMSTLLKSLPYIEMNWYNTYGKIYGVYGLKRPALTVAEPALVKQILVKEFHKFRNRMPETDPNGRFVRHLFNARDDHWRRLRHIISPAFSAGKLRRLYPLIGECCDEFVAAL
ncbi:unnamed protein product, partial [Medioppia subpectinata]